MKLKSNLSQLLKLHAFLISFFIGLVTISTSGHAVVDDSENNFCESVLSDSSIFRLRRQADRGLVAVGKTLAEKAVGLEALRGKFAPFASQVTNPEEFWALLLQSLSIKVEPTGSLERIPAQGKPVVIAANHPYGFLDGVSLAHVISQRRKDYMILGNATLSQIPEIRDRIIPLKIVAKNRKEQFENAKFNLQGIERAKGHLLSGGALIIFPSGVVGTSDTIYGVNDPAQEGPWQPTAARLIMDTGSSFLPAYFNGKNSTLFHLASRLPEKISGPLRLALIPSELLKKSGETVQLALGKEIKAVELDASTQGTKLSKDRAILALMRNETLKLSGDPSLFTVDAVAPAKSVPTLRIMAEVDKRLEKSRRVQLLNEALAAGKMEVYRESKSKLNGDPLVVYKVNGEDLAPELLHHLGVLREETFRHVGEGSGNSSDTDAFDLKYDHLLVWNDSAQDIVGAYRLGSYEEARATEDYSKMYSNEFFRYSPEFFRAFQGEMVEMGRSFVVTEHQNDPDILRLLWGGIAEHLYRDEKLRYLCGPVSLSGEYSNFSKTLIKSYYMKFHGDQTGLGEHITPSQNFTGEVALTPKILERYLDSLNKVSDLDSYIEAREGPGRGIPPLMKHYPGLLGAKFISVSEDPIFNTLDFLICVDIKDLNERKAEMFVGDKAKAKALSERFK